MTSRFSALSFRSWRLEWLDVLALAAWGILLLKYWLTGKLALLIHPNYFALAIAGGVSLLLIAVLQAWQLLRQLQVANIRHYTLFPPGWMSGVMLAGAIIGLLITPQPFNSHTAIQRGLSDSFTSTRVRPQAFRANLRSETRSLVDWVRTIDVRPEPDNYTGQKVNVNGFVVHSPNLSADYLTLTRFVITCCAADAYPVGLPVKLPQARQNYPQDSWYQVQGQMITETLNGQRQLVIQAKSLEAIAQPANPFAY